MKRVKLDHTAQAVRDFMRRLSVGAEPVELELNGCVLLTVLPSLRFSKKEKAALMREGQELVHRSRKRCKDIPAKVIEREVRRAVEAVRRRQQ